jgi:hypothetical protein
MLLIDTDIIVEFSRGSKQAADFLQQKSQTEKLAISTITAMGCLFGARNQPELQRLEKFLTQFDLAKLDAAISDRALQLIRQHTLSHGLEVPDALIAATAIVMDVPFASRNQRDYRFIGGLRLQSYP